ncbi:MAG: polysaccharide biosynthesis/export family protein [Flavobacterium sp.]
MKDKFQTKISLLLLVAGMLFSCTSKKNIVYLQSDGNQKTSIEMVNYEPMLQPDDALMIVISAENPEVAAPYNMKSVTFQSNSETAIGQERLLSYLIDKEGNVDFPLLGKIKLSGLTRIEAVHKIKTLLATHIKDPVVNLRILNFKVSVLGEVNKPGVQAVQTDRITLLEALSFSGDLTIYGNRNAIMIIREKEGVKTIEKIDITKRDFINSPYYYLSQNDVVYVEPNKTKVNASVIGPNITVGISALSLIITIIALTLR